MVWIEGTGAMRFEAVNQKGAARVIREQDMKQEIDTPAIDKDGEL
jgi:hypothetical protein